MDVFDRKAHETSHSLKTHVHVANTMPKHILVTTLKQYGYNFVKSSVKGRHNISEKLC